MSRDDTSLEGDPLLQSIVLVDSNMPKLEDCNEGCHHDKRILCLHRFNHPVEIEYCNNGNFSGVPDSEIILYFFNIILSRADEFIFETGKMSIFFIVTHDENFIKDVKREWIKKKQALNPHLKLEFFKDRISIKFWTFSIDLIVETIRSQKFGSSRVRDRKCIIDQVNSHLSP